MSYDISKKHVVMQVYHTHVINCTVHCCTFTTTYWHLLN